MRGLVEQKMQTNIIFGINFLHSWKYYDVLTLRPHDILFEHNVFLCNLHYTQRNRILEIILHQKFQIR